MCQKKKKKRKKKDKLLYSEVNPRNSIKLKETYCKDCTIEYKESWKLLPIYSRFETFRSNYENENETERSTR